MSEPVHAGGLTDDDVPAVWRSLGLPGLVDVHVHFMPERVLHKVWAYFDSAGPLTRVRWPIAYREAEQPRLDTLRRLGVRAFPSLVYPHKSGMAQWLNSWAGEFADRTPECLRTATFFPEPAAAGYVAAALDHGARLFKAHVQVGDYDPRDRLLDPVWGLLADARVPVVLHAASGPVAGRFTGPDPVAEVLARHPDLVLVVAHLGGPEYAEFFDLAERHAGVHLDTTMAFTDFLEREFAPFPRELSPRLRGLGPKVLFGTDFPNIPYPYAHQVEVLLRLDLGDDWLRGVLHDNAAALFGLEFGPASGR